MFILQLPCGGSLRRLTDAPRDPARPAGPRHQLRRQDKLTLSCQEEKSHGERMKLASKKKG